MSNKQQFECHVQHFEAFNWALESTKRKKNSWTCSMQHLYEYIKHANQQNLNMLLQLCFQEVPRYIKNYKNGKVAHLFLDCNFDTL